jgi:chromosome segregation ATPase
LERYKVKTEQLDRAAKQENERVANQRQIQLAILKQVLDIATQANVNEQAHVIRLGLIATIVEDNIEPFGFRMQTTLKRLDSLTNILRPIGILRNKLDDSEREIAGINVKLTHHKKRETSLASDLTALDRRLRSNVQRTEGERLKLEGEIALKKEELEKERAEHELNQKKLNEELVRKSEYTAELERVNKDLQVRVEAIRKAKAEIEADSVKLRQLVSDLSSQSQVNKKQTDELTSSIDKLTRVNASSASTIQNLKAMLDSLTEENRKLKTDLDAAKKPPLQK